MPGSSEWRRIEPSPPPNRGRLVTGLLIGLLAGALAAGSAGFFVGRSMADDSAAPEVKPTATPSAGALPPYEAAQQELNKAKFQGDLANLAGPWLPRMGACATNYDPGGPKMGDDERTHVFCRYGGLQIHFVEYKTTRDRDAARTYREHLYPEAGKLAPGLEKSSHKQGGVTNAPGTYVEYAFRAEDGRAMCGMWWNRDDSTIAGMYLATLCKEGLGGSWEPVRDLWQRYS